MPFCRSKCSYCDFYSFNADDSIIDNYTSVLEEHITLSGKRLGRPADTLYFGGGTPSLLGGERIARLVNAAKRAFRLENAEITVEVNPADDLYCDFEAIKSSGVNRISLGIQSANEQELAALSRRHSVNNVVRTIYDAKAAGIDNISVDLMLGIPHQTIKSLEDSLKFALSLGVNHISCYILKLEQGTPLYNISQSGNSALSLPDDETVAEMYLFMSDFLESRGFSHYEISNFALEGKQSKHNLKYWNCDEYLGLGPSAHSFINDKRFYFKRDLNKYLGDPEIVNDGDGGSSDEYIMLRLRLKEGIEFSKYESRYTQSIGDRFLKKAENFSRMGLGILDDRHFSLTQKGFLLSNSVIAELLE